MSLDFTLSIAALEVSDHNLDAPTFKDLEARYPELGFLFDHMHTMQDHFGETVPAKDYEELEEDYESLKSDYDTSEGDLRAAEVESDNLAYDLAEALARIEALESASAGDPA